MTSSEGIITAPLEGAAPPFATPAGAQNLSGNIPKLDFLRAVSAAVVVLYHSGYVFITAGFGVLTFFVISGFLITHLLVRENEKTGSVSLKNFYVRRSLRIFPALYVYWIIAIAALALRDVKIIWPQAICTLLYVNNYYQGLHGYPSSLFSHTWSLGVEEQFYLLWPWLFVFFRNRLNRLTRILLFLIPLLWIYRSGLYFWGASDAYIYTSFETRVDAILVGCLFAILLQTGAAAAFIAEVRRARYLPITIVCLITSIYANTSGFFYRDVIGFAIDPLLTMALIAQLISLRSAAWMDSKPISYLGRISYSTYLYQQLVIPFITKALPGLPQAAKAICCVLGTWLISAISYQLVEKPFLRLKERFTLLSSQRRRDVANA